MPQTQSSIDQLKAQGHRITSVREAIVHLFEQLHTPLRAVDILEHLHAIDMKPNKTTVYRELDFLVTHGIIKAVRIYDESVCYELVDRPHHHHMVCKQCGLIIDFVPPDELEELVTKTQQTLERKHKVRITDHSLEFFGICDDCKASEKHQS